VSDTPSGNQLTIARNQRLAASGFCQAKIEVRPGNTQGVRISNDAGMPGCLFTLLRFHYTDTVTANLESMQVQIS
jgi:hypothetical protein